MQSLSPCWQSQYAAWPPVGSWTGAIRVTHANLHKPLPSRHSRGCAPASSPFCPSVGEGSLLAALISLLHNHVDMLNWRAAGRLPQEAGTCVGADVPPQATPRQPQGLCVQLCPSARTFKQVPLQLSKTGHPRFCIAAPLTGACRPAARVWTAPAQLPFTTAQGCSGGCVPGHRPGELHMHRRQVSPLTAGRDGRTAGSAARHAV